MPFGLIRITGFAACMLGSVYGLGGAVMAQSDGNSVGQSVNTIGVQAGVDAWERGAYEDAIRYWTGPAQGGDPSAQYNLAQAYRMGRGVPEDPDMALQLYAAASAQGHQPATDNYALLLFQRGRRAEAMPLLKEASGRGDPRAQYYVGLAHFNAEFADRDWVRAYALMTLSNASGVPQAKSAIAQMDQYIPIEERQRAQALALELKAEAERRSSAFAATQSLRRATQSANSQSASVPQSPSFSSAPRTAPVVINLPRSSYVGLERYAGSRSTGPAKIELPQASAAPVAAVARAEEVKPPAQLAKPVSTSATTRGGDWVVQLGAFGVPENAQRLKDKYAGSDLLKGRELSLKPSGRLTFVQAPGFETRGEAASVCEAFKRQRQDCLVTNR